RLHHSAHGYHLSPNKPDSSLNTPCQSAFRIDSGFDTTKTQPPTFRRWSAWKGRFDLRFSASARRSNCFRNGSLRPRLARIAERIASTAPAA
ncbi:hypothetical protein TNCV_2390571, partial [Trichonephila clavipes]